MSWISEMAEQERQRMAGRVREAMPEDMRTVADGLRKKFNARLVSFHTDGLHLGEPLHEIPPWPRHDINHPERYPQPDPVAGIYEAPSNSPWAVYAAIGGK